MPTKTEQRPTAPTAHQAQYENLLSKARLLISTDANTRFELAALFVKMLKVKSADEIAEDTDVTASAVARMAVVSRFWGDVRIRPDGKRKAPWHLYDRIAHDIMIKDQRREQIKLAAPQGLAIVREMLRDARNVSIEEVNAIARATREATPTKSKPAPLRSNRNGRQTGRSVEVDGSVFVTGAIQSLESAITSLDRLESLSDEDAARLRTRISGVAAQVARLTSVPR